jgi:hypothetical protein
VIILAMMKPQVMGPNGQVACLTREMNAWGGALVVEWLGGVENLAKA